MKVKPLNTEANRTALAEKIVQSLSARELYDYAVHMMATIYDNTPDVFQTGHLHREGHMFYRGTPIVCCGAWQSQTDYQKSLGIEPTVGSASIIDLDEIKLSILDFLERV